ncbi:MAG: PHP domain-containing protein [Acidobacteriota bacterium]
MIVDCLAHVHSSFSYDSQMDLTDIARTARRHGIQCVLMSEHNNLLTATQMADFVGRCDELSDETLLIVPGLELAFDSNRVHLLAFGVRRYIQSTGPACTFRSLIDAVRQADGVPVLAHPTHRQAVDRLDPGDLEELDGIEIWNAKNGNRFFPTVPDLEILKRVRTTVRTAFGFAGADWHDLNRFPRLVLRIDVPTLTRDAILGRLKSGAFMMRGRWVSLPSTGETRRGRLMTYRLASNTLARVRRTAYRWQSQMERRGVRTPKTILAVARRLF